MHHGAALGRGLNRLDSRPGQGLGVPELLCRKRRRYGVLSKGFTDSSWYGMRFYGVVRQGHRGDAVEAVAARCVLLDIPGIEIGGPRFVP